MYVTEVPTTNDYFKREEKLHLYQTSLRKEKNDQHITLMHFLNIGDIFYQSPLRKAMLYVLVKKELAVIGPPTPVFLANKDFDGKYTLLYRVKGVNLAQYNSSTHFDFTSSNINTSFTLDFPLYKRQRITQKLKRKRNIILNNYSIPLMN